LRCADGLRWWRLLLPPLLSASPLDEAGQGFPANARGRPTQARQTCS
jgi:hypothetical protein